ncbi:MAG TPA: hypothetical protein VF599_02505 [Pyrinomonadaceae bacterium]|jgi:hypothetical protein
MNKLKRFSVFAVFALFLCFNTQGFAQENKDVKLAEPSYEVLLQVLVGSNASSDNNQMPSSSLGNVVKKLKTTFPFTDYRLTATYLNRVENGGAVESRGVIQETNASATPTFQDWSLHGVKRVSDAGGQNLVQVGIFQFGTRFPIQLGQAVNYEQTGLKINRLNLAENSPTIVGTLNASKTSELIVLVLTVRSSN